LARYFGIDSPINTPSGIKEFKALAIELLDKEVPEIYNQAVMEFGAIQCKPQNPLCESCPLAESCIALRDGKISQLPVKLKTLKIKKRYFNYLVFISEENKTLIEKRIGKGIWQGLYQFPLVETKKQLEAGDIVAEEKFISLAGENPKDVTLYNDTPILHKLTHQHIFAHFWLIQEETLAGNAVPVENLVDYPVPVLIANFLKECNIPEYNLPHPELGKSNSDPAVLSCHSSDARGEVEK
jgi:A/G-specific adenine glycosylase